jgi:hypothetical protein
MDAATYFSKPSIALRLPYFAAKEAATREQVKGAGVMLCTWWRNRIRRALPDAPTNHEKSHSVNQFTAQGFFKIYNFMKRVLLHQRAVSPEIETSAKFLAAGAYLPLQPAAALQALTKPKRRKEPKPMERGGWKRESRKLSGTHCQDGSISAEGA